MRALEHGVFWKRDGVVCTIYKYINVFLFVTSLSTDREKGFDFFFSFFSSSLEGEGRGFRAICLLY